MGENVFCGFQCDCSTIALEDTFKKADSVEQMKYKLSDQANIVNLQNKLTEAKEEQVKKLQETVQSEVKSVQSEMKKFSSVLQKEIKDQSIEVQKNVFSAFSLKKIGDTVKKVVEKEERGKNVVIYGVPEGSTETSETCIGKIMEHVDKNPQIVDCFCTPSGGNSAEFICCCRGFEKLKVA